MKVDSLGDSPLFHSCLGFFFLTGLLPLGVVGRQFQQKTYAAVRSGDDRESHKEGRAIFTKAASLQKVWMLPTVSLSAYKVDVRGLVVGCAGVDRPCCHFFSRYRWRVSSESGVHLALRSWAGKVTHIVRGALV